MWCEVYVYTTGCNVHGEKNCRRKIIRKREQRISERLKVLSAIKIFETAAISKCLVYISL